MFTSVAHMLMAALAQSRFWSTANQLTLAEQQVTYRRKTNKTAHTRSGASAIKRAAKKARNRKRSK